MDEYIDNLGILKKHLDYHFPALTALAATTLATTTLDERYSMTNLYYICMVHRLEKLLIN